MMIGRLVLKFQEENNMKVVYCPICNKRICDSNKNLKVNKFSESDEVVADMVIKCQKCKNCLSIKVSHDEAG